MWEQAIWPLLITMITNINGEGHLTKREGSSLIQELASVDSNPARTLVDVQAPIMTTPVKLAQQEDSSPRSLSDIWMITPPPSLGIPKWIPDFQPIKEKHWDAIVHAIDTTWKQDSKNDHTTSKQESIKPSEHIRHKDEQAIDNNRRRIHHQNLNQWSSNQANGGNTRLKLPWSNVGLQEENRVKYITWPNTEPKNQAIHIRNLPTSNMKNIFNNTGHITQLTRPKVALENFNPIMSQLEMSETKASVNAVRVEQQQKQLSNSIEVVNSPTISTLSLKNDPLQLNKTTFQSPNLNENQITNVSSQVGGITPPSTLVSSDVASNNQLLKTTENHGGNFSAENDKEKSKTNTNSKQKSSETSLTGEVFDQPWLHATVQHDLKQWGYPYDKEAALYPYVRISDTQGQQQNEPNLTTSSFLQSNVGNQIATQKDNPLLPSKQEQHLAIIEVPKGTNNRPIPIKNIHVIAPKPDNVPPVPLFRPSEKKELKSSPYLLQGPEARSPGIKNNDPMLVVPYPSQDSENNSSSGIYPVIVPLNKASDRQDDSPFQMIMRPLRNMFQFGRNTGNGPPNKPLPTRQTLPKEQVPEDIQPPPIHTQEFPGFGPPKDDDVVVAIDSPSLQQVDEINEILSNEKSIPAAPQEALSLHSQQQQPQNEILPLNVPFPQSNEFPTTFNHPQNQNQQQFQPPTLPATPSFQTESQNNEITQNQHQLLRPPPASFRPRPFRQIQNQVLPPVLNTFQQNPPEFKRPAPQSFRPWPDTRQPTTVSNTLLDTQELRDSNNENLLTSTTSRPPFSFFNRPPTLPSFRMPTLPNMRFLNPFNMFRSRENGNSGFSLFPSLFSKSDKDKNFARENGAQIIPLQPNHTPLNSPQISSHDAKTKFFRNIKSPSLKQESSFTFMPHLPPVFRNNDIPPPQKTSTQLQPPPATYYSLSKPLLQPPPFINNLKENNDNIYQNTKDNAKVNSKTTTSLNTFSTDNSDEAIFIVSQERRDSSERQNADSNLVPLTLTHFESTAAVVNPQTNPARQSNNQKDTNDIHIVPPLIKFTLDDVVRSPETFNTGNQFISEVPQATRDNFKHVFEEDMEFAPSEEVLTVAEFSEARELVTPVTVLEQNIEPTAKSQHMSTIPLAEKEHIYTTTPKAHHHVAYNTPKTSSSLTTLNLSARNMPQLTTPPNFTPTTIQYNNSPVTFSTYITTKTLSNNNTQENDSLLFPQIKWMIAQPEDSENTENSKQNNLSEASSSKFTIIEATPMPKQGEIFPTVTHYDSYSTPTTSSVSTESSASDYSSAKFVITNNNNLHTNNNKPISNKDQNNHEVLLPGSSNHRTMKKHPKVELNPLVNPQSTNRGAEQNSNNSKIRYNSLPRKVFHAHRDELQSSVIKDTPTSIAPASVPEKGQDHHNSTPSLTTKTYQDPITEASFEITTFVSHPASTSSLSSQKNNITHSKELFPILSYEESITQSSVPTTATVRSYLVGKPSRYNSLQRLRDSIARKKTDTNANSELLFTTTSVPTTDHTTKLPFTLPKASTTMPIRFTAVSSTNLTRSFPSLRTHTSSIKTASSSKLSDNAMLTTTTTSKPQQHGTHLPKQTTTTFKQTDNEPSESGSSSSYKWRPPVQDVFLQDHPDMLNIYNWESARLSYAQDRSDVPAKFENHNNQYGGADRIQSDVSTAAVLSTQELTPLPLSLLSGDFSVSSGIPGVILSKRDSYESSSPKVHEETSSSQINNAWKIMTRGIEQRETPYTSNLSSLHNHYDPMMLRT